MRPRFHGPLMITPVRQEVKGWRRFLFGRQRWEILADFSYSTYLNPVYFTGESKARYLITPITITATQGRVLDLATIPRIAWPFFPPYHVDYGEATVPHDICLADALYNKAWAEAVFEEALGVCKCPADKKRFLTWFTRNFGRGNYR